MSSPYIITNIIDAQSVIVINSRDFKPEYRSDCVSIFRFIVKQPSPLWKKYELRNIESFPLSSSHILSRPPSPDRKNKEVNSKSSLLSVGTLLSKQLNELMMLRKKEESLLPSINDISLQNKKVINLVISKSRYLNNAK